MRIRSDLVCVVTPVHNAGDYIEECIRSVLIQSHENWTYLICDNASTDSTPDISHKYSQLDSRIHLIRFEDFVGQKDSFNRAFSSVDGSSTWCKPLMGDDWLYPNCLEQMIAAGNANPRIGLVGGYQRWGDTVFWTEVPYDRSTLPGRGVIARMLFSGENVIGGPTAQMFRTDVIVGQAPFFDRDLEHADTDAAFRTLIEYDFGFVHQVLTYARRQGGTQFDWGYSVGSLLVEQLLTIVRYGRLVLDEDRYRATLRRQLKWCTRYQLKQAIRPSRLHDTAFLDYHQRIIDCLSRDNVHNDLAVDRYVRLVTALLERRRLAEFLRVPQRRRDRRPV